MSRIARRPLSQLLALLPEGHASPGFEELARNLERSGLPATLCPSGRRLRAVLRERERPRGFEVDVEMRTPRPEHLEPCGNPECEFSAPPPGICVSVSGKLGQDPLESLHAQLRLLAALAPEAVAMLDLNSFLVKSGDWMRDAASAGVPPSATSFFGIHCVFDEKNGRETWLHTHGLRRMGSIDLDIVGIRRRDSRALGTLLNHVGKWFIEQGVPPPDTVFEPGRDLPLVWLPLEAALQHVDPLIGAAAHRDDEHRVERGILLAPGAEGRLEAPRRYARLLEADPILYVSPSESQRMQRLAQERLPRFLSLRDRFGKNKKWSFQVKLGLPTTDHGHPEHLWFDVHEASAETVDGTLVNQPWLLRGLREGHRGTFDLRFMSDWAIHSPRATYTPETVLQLERGLANDAGCRPPLLH
jgi:uncharacterized protein YegJ (DUF2314 family)